MSSPNNSRGDRCAEWAFETAAAKAERLHGSKAIASCEDVLLALGSCASSQWKHNYPAKGPAVGRRLATASLRMPAVEASPPLVSVERVGEDKSEEVFTRCALNNDPTDVAAVKIATVDDIKQRDAAMAVEEVLDTISATEVTGDITNQLVRRVEPGSATDTAKVIGPKPAFWLSKATKADDTNNSSSSAVSARVDSSHGSSERFPRTGFVMFPGNNNNNNGGESDNAPAAWRISGAIDGQGAAVKARWFPEEAAKNSEKQSLAAKLFSRAELTYESRERLRPLTPAPGEEGSNRVSSRLRAGRGVSRTELVLDPPTLDSGVGALNAWWQRATGLFGSTGLVLGRETDHPLEANQLHCELPSAFQLPSGTTSPPRRRSTTADAAGNESPLSEAESQHPQHLSVGGGNAGISPALSSLCSNDGAIPLMLPRGSRSTRTSTYFGFEWSASKALGLLRESFVKVAEKDASNKESVASRLSSAFLADRLLNAGAMPAWQHHARLLFCVHQKARPTDASHAATSQLTIPALVAEARGVLSLPLARHVLLRIRSEAGCTTDITSLASTARPGADKNELRGPPLAAFPAVRGLDVLQPEARWFAKLSAELHTPMPRWLLGSKFDGLWFADIASNSRVADVVGRLNDAAVDAPPGLQGPKELPFDAAVGFALVSKRATSSLTRFHDVRPHRMECSFSWLLDRPFSGRLNVLPGSTSTTPERSASGGEAVDALSFSAEAAPPAASQPVGEGKSGFGLFADPWRYPNATQTKKAKSVAMDADGAEGGAYAPESAFAPLAFFRHLKCGLVWDLSPSE